MLASVVYDCLVTPYLNVHCKLCNLPSDPKEKAQAGFWLSDKWALAAYVPQAYARTTEQHREALREAGFPLPEK